MSLIAHYRLDDLIDAIGNNDLEIVNDSGNLLQIQGKMGFAYERIGVDSSNDHFKAKTPLLFNGDFTLSCWAFVREAAESANGLVSFHNHTNFTGSGITVKHINSTDYRISCNTADGTSRTYHTHYGTSNIHNRWAHLVVRYDSVNQLYSLWVDGVKENEFSYNQYNVLDDFRIFNWSNDFMSGSYRPDCILDDVRAYDHALSEKEIKELAKGMILHYKFDIDDTDIIDYSGQGYNTTKGLGGATHPTWTSEGIVGKGALHFGGNSSSDGLKAFDHTEAEVFKDVFSFSTWFKSETETGDSFARIISRDASDYFSLALVQNTGPSQALRLYINSGYQEITTITSFQYYHVVVTFDIPNSTYRAYVNGVKELENTSFGGFVSSADRDIIIGCNSEVGINTINIFEGLIDDVRFYTTELSTNEARELYQRRASLDDQGTFEVYGLSPALNRRGAETDIICASTSAAVVAYEDDTEVYLNGVLQSTIAKQTPYTMTTAIGDVISSNKPLTSGSTNAGVPVGWAGKQFSFRNDRYDPVNVYVYAPFEDAVVDLYRSDDPYTIIDTQTITAGSFHAFSTVSVYVYIIESDSLVSVYVSPTTGDERPLYPCSHRIYGIPSAHADVTFIEDNTSVIKIMSNGSTSTTIKNRGETWSPGGSGAQYSGDSQLFIADKPISAMSQADGDGGEVVSYIAREAFATHFILPQSTEWVVFYGQVEGATVDVYDHTGVYLDTKTMTGGIGENVPTKLKIDGAIEAYTLVGGFKFVCSHPCGAIYEYDVGDDETVLYGTSYGTSYGEVLSVSNKGLISDDVSEVSVSDGLVHWYPFDGDTKDYADTDDAIPSSADPEHRGYRINGGSFGAGSYIDMGGNKSISQFGGSLAFWVNFDDATQHCGLFTPVVDGGFDNLIDFRKNYFHCETAINCNQFDSPSFNTLNSGQWYHFAVVFNNEKSYWYMDGNYIGETSNYGTIDCNSENPTDKLEAPFTFSYIAGSAYKPALVGMISDVRVYDLALSAENVATIYTTTDPTNQNRMSQGTDKLYIKNQIREVNL